MRSILIARQAAGALLGLMVFVTVALAQSSAGRRAGPRQASARAEEVRQAMEQMVIARMRVALHLTQDQEATVVPRVQELLVARRDHAAKRRDSMARLRSLLLDGTAGDQEIGRALRDLRALEDDLRGRGRVCVTRSTGVSPRGSRPAWCSSRRASAVSCNGGSRRRWAGPRDRARGEVRVRRPAGAG